MLKRLRVLAGAFALMAILCTMMPMIGFADDGGVDEADQEQSELTAQALPSADYSWYTGHESDTSYSLLTANQLLAFANLVNGADGKTATTFEGKTITLTGSSYNLGAGEWIPIGDSSHQFLGTFDGNGKTVSNFKVSGTNRSAYLGLFGYVGTGGSVSNVTVDSSAKISVTRDAKSSDVLHHIGGVAGYCAGTMSNCTNKASVTVSTDAVQTADNPQVAYAIGGVAGECVFDMVNCSNSGAITVSATSDPVSSVDDSALVHYVGGVVGVLGDSTRIGKGENPIATDPSKHGEISGCTNFAKIIVDTPSEAGLDRFGSTAFARSVAVGGVVGYSQGNVTSCTNGMVIATGTHSDAGYVRAEHATSAGGIVGSMRGLFGSDNPTGRAEQDDGMAGNGNDPIVIAYCTNYGDVYALNAVGGIAGHAGTYTSIKGCVNSNKASGVRTYIVGTRWNKPAPAGIVGSTSGDVAYCANLGTILSGTWTNEDARQYKTGNGYYVAGIVGMLSYYSKVDSTTQSVAQLSPTPEVYGCYNAGDILAGSGMRQRGIVGENDGHVHDCALLKGTVESDKIAYGDQPGDSEANGTVSNCKVYTADELKTDEPIALLNAGGSPSEFESGFYWKRTTGSDVQAHYGYPVLSTNTVAPTPIDLSSATATSTSPLQNARYNGAKGGGETIPSVTVKVGSTTLTAGVDYYVVPQANATEISEGASTPQPYRATVKGIGRYTGTIENVAYGISKGRLADCTMTVEGRTFNYNVQYPTVDMTTVKTKSGVVIDPSEYEIVSLTDSTGNVTTTPTNRGNYKLTIKVKEESAHFSTTEGNTLTATYRISPASIMSVVDYSKVTITWEGKTYPWVSSTDEEDVAHPKTTFAYTGQPIKPTVSGITYNGHELIEGVDYRIVYGNPNPENGDTGSHDTNNVGVPGKTSLGCITIRYYQPLSGASNYTNYTNMFIAITDDGTWKTEMHRLYNPNSGEHFYTASAKEKDGLVKVGWNYEGVGWTAPKTSSTPVYRLYNKYAGDHHYTTSAKERDGLVKAGWNDEGIGWYSDDAEGVPLFRQYNPNARTGTHNYTKSKKENDYLVSLGWKAEGIGWYGVEDTSVAASSVDSSALTPGSI